MKVGKKKKRKKPTSGDILSKGLPWVSLLPPSNGSCGHLPISPAFRSSKYTRTLRDSFIVRVPTWNMATTCMRGLIQDSWRSPFLLPGMLFPPVFP